MIQWIALAVAVDANSKAGDAKNVALEAEHNSKSRPGLVIVRPVDLIKDENDNPPPGTGFFGRLCYFRRQILDKEPWGTISIRKSDILSMAEYSDGLGQPYVSIRISEYAKVYRGENWIIRLRVPGTIEQVASAISYEGK